MGKPAGVMNNEGQYPEGSINFNVVSRLKEISDMAHEDENEDDEEKETKEAL